MSNIQLFVHLIEIVFCYVISLVHQLKLYYTEKQDELVGVLSSVLLICFCGHFLKFPWEMMYSEFLALICYSLNHILFPYNL